MSCRHSSLPSSPCQDEGTSTGTSAFGAAADPYSELRAGPMPCLRTRIASYCLTSIFMLAASTKCEYEYIRHTSEAGGCCQLLPFLCLFSLLQDPGPDGQRAKLATNAAVLVPPFAPLVRHGIACPDPPGGIQASRLPSIHALLTVAVILTDVLSLPSNGRLSLLHVDDGRGRNYSTRRRQLDCHLLMQTELSASPASTIACRQYLDAAKWSRPRPLVQTPMQRRWFARRGRQAVGLVRNKRSISISI
ncbi:hypothetical protein J3F83DRAFT_583662 [Trichoderma novae-zelandiae]